MGIFNEFFRAKLSIYLQNYVKNGLIFKTANQIIFFFNTVHNLITFSMVFTNKNGGGHFEPPPNKTKVCKPPIITKGKPKSKSWQLDRIRLQANISFSWPAALFANQRAVKWSKPNKNGLIDTLLTGRMAAKHY